VVQNATMTLTNKEETNTLSSHHMIIDPLILGPHYEYYASKHKF
jgi:hypothetical protein